MKINNKTAQFCRRNSDGEIIMTVDTHHRRAQKWVKDGVPCSWDTVNAETVPMNWDDIKSFSDWEEMI